MKKNSKHSLQFAVLVVGVLIAVLFFALTNSKTDAPQTNNQGFDNQKKSSSQ